MVKYSVVHLDINGKNLRGVDNLRDVEKNALSTRNAIYIYRGTKTQLIYGLLLTVKIRPLHIFMRTDLTGDGTLLRRTG